jgi:hypothetical protein
VLYEFVLTPDVFDRKVLGGNPALGVTLIQLLRGMCDNGLVANLHRDRWFNCVEDRVEQLSADLPNLKDKILSCFKTLHDRHRFVRHPRRLDGDPAGDNEWLDLALESHRRIPFHGIVLSRALLVVAEHNDPAFMELSGSLDSPHWQNRRRSVTLTKCEADYRSVLTLLLRHAKTLSLVDPYLSCHDARFFDTVKICVEVLGQRGHAVLPCRVHIHAGDPSPESVSDRLNAWEYKLRPLINPQRPHRFKVLLWKPRPGRETMHDRYILTDQCGISVPAGLDCRVHSVPNSTTWSLLDEEDRARRLQDYDPTTSPFELMGEREVV